jgi:hypothetical protein
MASSDDLIFTFATESSAKRWYYLYVVLSAVLLGLMITMYIFSYDIIDSISNNKVCKYTNEQKLVWQNTKCGEDTKNVAKKCPPCIKGTPSNQPSNQLPNQPSNQLPNQPSNQPSNQLPNQISNQPSNQLSNQPPKNIIENMIVDYGWEECSNLTKNLSTPIKEKNIQLLSVLRYYNIILVLIILYLISASGFIIYFKSKM